MSNKRYTEEFKIEAFKQITDCGYSAHYAAKRLGTTREIFRCESEINR